LNGPPLICVADGTFSHVDDLIEWFSDSAEIKVVPIQPERLHAGLTGEAPQGLIVGLQRVDRRVLDALPGSVRAPSRAGIGLDSIDLAAAAERKLAVIHQPDYATAEVATHAVALMLALNRRLLRADRVARNGWLETAEFGEIEPIEECTVGIVGLGRIGSAVAERVRPLAKEIIAFDPAVSYAPRGVTLVSALSELLRRSNILTLHLPLADETRRLIGADELALLPQGALLINVARGGIVDEDALVEALASGHLQGAALDVLEQEPPASTSPLLMAPNVILSPHIAWMSNSAESRLKRQAVQSLLDFLVGRELSAGRLAVLPASTTTVASL
jgi:D-3-phosphoglycerate dehydrogenase / 2-oxoglutarate reductase